MRSMASFFGSAFFFSPFIYVFFYLLIEKYFPQHLVAQKLLKVVTVVLGLFSIIYAWITPTDVMVLLPSRGGEKHYLSSSLFLMIVGAATISLPLWSKHIKFSNSDN